MSIADSPGAAAPPAPWTDDYLGDAVTTALLDFLETRRVQQGLSHNKFARLVGLNPATWSQIRTRKVPCGPAFIGRVVVALPAAALIFERRAAAQAGVL